jgi:hypothetical protein
MNLLCSEINHTMPVLKIIYAAIKAQKGYTAAVCDAYGAA